MDVFSTLITLFWPFITSFVLCFMTGFLIPLPKKNLRKFRYIVSISMLLAIFIGSYWIVGTNAPEQTQEEYIVNLFSLRFLYLFMQFIPIIFVVNFFLLYFGSTMHTLVFKKHH